MTVTRAAFGRAYNQARRDQDAVAAAYAATVAAVFAAHGRRVQTRLGQIRRSVSVTVPPVTADDRPSRDPDPPLTHIRSSEVFLDGLDDDLKAKMRPAIDRNVAVVGGLLIGGLWAQAGQAHDALVDAQTRRLGYVGDAVADRVDATLGAAYRAGDTFGGLADRIGGLFDQFGSWYADRVGGDEATATLNGTATSAAQWGGLVGVQRTWNCVLPDTPVTAAGAFAVARRWHEGTIIRLRTASGRVVAVTPEHPVLTTHGWVAADRLDVGDDLVRYTFDERQRGVEPDEDDRPAAIGEVFRAAHGTGPDRRMVRLAVNLDSDGRRRQVEVVPIDGVLRGRLQPACDEPAAQHVLALADLYLGALLADGDGPGPLDGTRPGREAGHPSTLTAPLAYVARLVRAADVTGRRLAAYLDTGRLGEPTDVIRPEPVRRAEDACRLPGDVPGDDLVACGMGVHAGPTSGDGDRLCRPRLGDGRRIGSEPEARRVADVARRVPSSAQIPEDGRPGPADRRSDLRGTLAAVVATDQVVDVVREAYAGHVYDLSTPSRWFIADGIVVHNSQDDDRVRPEHDDADGQTVGVDEPFNVGGETLWYPGDPDGSAWNVINCRCWLSFVTAEGDDLVDDSDAGLAEGVDVPDGATTG